MTDLIKKITEVKINNIEIYIKEDYKCNTAFVTERKMVVGNILFLTKSEV